MPLQTCQEKTSGANSLGVCVLFGSQGSGPGEGLPEDVTRRFFQQLILALDFCQRLGIANRWVHPHLSSWVLGGFWQSADGANQVNVAARLLWKS